MESAASGVDGEAHDEKSTRRTAAAGLGPGERGLDRLGGTVERLEASAPAA